jgi:hypothetical protein
MSAGLDFAFAPHASVASMKTAGVQFVCRYGKNLVPAEAKALLAAGFGLVVVVEEGASMMLGGAPAGKAAAQHADAVVKALGMPGMPVYYAADFDATPSQQTPVNAFLDGAASVIGRSRTGIYGGFYVIKRALDAGKAHFSWQTPAWSGGQWDSRVNIRQGLSFTLGGGAVDHDTALTSDYGQWPRPKPPPPAGTPYRHLTAAGDTVHSIAVVRRMKVEDWVAYQRKSGADVAALAGGPLPAGLTWYSVNP